MLSLATAFREWFSRKKEGRKKKLDAFAHLNFWLIIINSNWFFHIDEERYIYKDYFFV